MSGIERILAHRAAATGAIAVETREESRLVRELCGALPGVEIATYAAPAGPVWQLGADGRRVSPPMIASPRGPGDAFAWATGAAGRVLIVFDAHPLINNPILWRSIIEALPALRSPAGATETETASLLVFVGGSWDLSQLNQIRDALPVVAFDPPDRQGINAILATLNCDVDGPPREAIVDALCGLGADVAEQVAAEQVAAAGNWTDVDGFRSGRRGALRRGGLEIWPTVETLGGLGGLRSFVESDLIPWIRDPQLAIRRILCAGVPGVGKSYCARWIAHKLGCECARVSIPALKGGIVGQSEGNLRRCLGVVDAMAQHAPLVVVVDEIDTIARDGLDGGVSSGMFSELLTWLQESTSQALVIATLNRLDKLDAALESRFAGRFFFDLPTVSERVAIAELHFARLNCENPARSAEFLASVTDGFSSREIAESLIPSIARRSNRAPTEPVIRAAAAAVIPSAQTQRAQLDDMRRAASALTRANDTETGPAFARHLGPSAN